VQRHSLYQEAVIRFIRNPDAAPEFAVKGIDGSTVNPASARGKVVLLNVWATWCGPCRSEFPDLVELQKKYQDKLQVIGLVVDDADEDAVRKFVKHYGINYPVAMATDEVRFQFGGVPALPTSFIVDAQGRVVQKHIGLRDPELYEMEVRALLGLPISARVETFEDTGEIFLKHANRASELPGVDMTSLTPAQKTAALRRMNEETKRLAHEDANIHWRNAGFTILLVASAESTLLESWLSAQIVRLHLSKTLLPHKLPHRPFNPNRWPSPRKVFSYWR